MSPRKHGRTRMGPGWDPLEDAYYDHPLMVAARAGRRIYDAVNVKTQTGAPTRGFLGPSVVGGELSQSSWTHFKQVNDHLRRKVKEIVGEVRRMDNQTGVFDGTVGEQTPNVITNQSAGVENYYGDFGYTDLQNMYAQLEDTYPDIAAANQDNLYRETGWMYVRDIEIVTDFCNMSNQMVWFTLYDMVKSQSDRLSGVGTAKTGDKMDPINLWNYGVQQQVVFGNGPLSPSVPGTVPTESVRFCQEWHIHQTTMVCLGPGDLHRHTVKFAPNHLMQRSRWVRDESTASATVADYIEGLTHFTMIVQHGQVCCSNVPGNATYGNSRLCWISTRKLTVQFGFGEVVSDDGADLALDDTMATTVMNQDTANAEAFERAGG